MDMLTSPGPVPPTQVFNPGQVSAHGRSLLPMNDGGQQAWPLGVGLELNE
jgi:hypothetical protein